MSQNGPSNAKVTHNFQGFLSVSEVAKRLGKSRDTVLRWCESGKLSAVSKPFGKKVTYLVPSASVEVMRQAIESARQLPLSSSQSAKPHSEYFNAWVQAMKQGVMTGKPYSPLTVRDYETYVRLFLTARPVVSAKMLEAELLKVSASQYGKRFKVYKGVVCFGKFLIRQGALEKSFLEEVKPFYPKRHAPPKRTVLDEAQLKQLMGEAKTPFQKMMLAVLAGTGLRASEAVTLKRADVDLERGVLTVRKGKGNKTRTLGLSPALVSAMASYFYTVSSEWVFSDEAGNPLGRTSLYHRLKRLGDRAGMTVTPHSLRRAFVTINAGKGRPLVYLQKSCGHSDIRTTMGYCLTTEQEVIEAMKDW